MRSTMNGIEYTTSTSNGFTKVSWDTGSYTVKGLTERQALEKAVMEPLRLQREEIFKETSWRFQTNYPYDDQDEWATYLQEWRDLPSTYIHGQDIILPNKPGE